MSFQCKHHTVACYILNVLERVRYLGLITLIKEIPFLQYILCAMPYIHVRTSRCNALLYSTVKTKKQSFNLCSLSTTWSTVHLEHLALLKGTVVTGLNLQTVSATAHTVLIKHLMPQRKLGMFVYTYVTDTYDACKLLTHDCFSTQIQEHISDAAE